MKPFRVQLSAFVMAEDQVDALRRTSWLAAAARGNGMVSGGAEVLVVTDEEIDNLKALQRLVDRYTQPEHGDPASPLLRRRLVRALAADHGGDADHAESIVKTMEEGAGYLPRSIAERLLERHPTARAA